MTAQHVSGQDTGCSWEAENPKRPWDREASMLLQIYKESGHTVVLGMTTFEQGTIKEKGDK